MADPSFSIQSFQAPMIFSTSSLSICSGGVALHLKDAGVTKSNMFGMPVLKLDRRPIAGLASDGVNFKLPADGPEMKKALAMAGAYLFRPMHGKEGPLMKQWVVVLFARAEQKLVYARLTT